jgi:hypothetical protein
MSEKAYFKKLNARTAPYTYTDSAGTLHWSKELVFGRDGYLATDNNKVKEALREMIQRGAGGIEEMSLAEWNEFLKKKPTMTPGQVSLKREEITPYNLETLQNAGAAKGQDDSLADKFKPDIQKKFEQSLREQGIPETEIRKAQLTDSVAKSSSELPQEEIPKPKRRGRPPKNSTSETE